MTAICPGIHCKIHLDTNSPGTMTVEKKSNVNTGRHKSFAMGIENDSNDYSNLKIIQNARMDVLLLIAAGISIR